MTQSKKKEPHIVMTVQKENIGAYTSLLQSGISLGSFTGHPLGIFLNNLPGFDADYIVNRIQTIFLDGNALDDMNSVFSKNNQVLALSAAMPGLAGAIFRRNSLHSALRTSTQQKTAVVPTENKISVCLKLFNMIATEKGPGILEQGGFFTGQVLLDFFLQRQSLTQNIKRLEIENTSITGASFFGQIDPDTHYHVIIQSDKDIQ